MKIQKIHIHNLNSLKGNHEVDLTADPLANAGLFVITGPTGAGKSTILDAVTLALYGRAARYGKEKSPEHMMSKNTGECSAEVEFEVSGVNYRAVWQRHRSGNSSGGKIQPPKRYIYDEVGQSLVRGTKEAEQEIEKLIGLDYERFLRSALLAQGEFARFMKAKPDERADLLESLTGTTIYSRLSIFAFEESRRRETEINDIKIKIGEALTLDPAERADLTKKITLGKNRKQQLRESIKKENQLIQKINRLESGRAKEIKINNDIGLLEKEKLNLEHDIQKLEKHKNSEPYFDLLNKVENSEAAYSEKKNELSAAERNYEEAVEEYESEKYYYHCSLEDEVAYWNNQIKEASIELSELRKSVEDIEKWLKKNKADQNFEKATPGLIKELNSVTNLRDRLETDWDNWLAEIQSVDVGLIDEYEDEIDEETSETKLQKKLKASLDEVASIKKEVGSKLKSAEKDSETCFDNYMEAQSLASLEEHRHQLVYGEACPLCGSEEHPHADMKTSASSLKKYKRDFEKAKKEYQKLQKEFEALAQSSTELKKINGSLTRSYSKFKEVQSSLRNKLKKFDLQLVAYGEEEDLEEVIVSRGQSYKDKIEEKENCLTEIKDNELGLKENSIELGSRTLKLNKLGKKSDEFKPLNKSDLLDSEDAENEYETFRQALRDGKNELKIRIDSEKKSNKELAKTESLLVDQLKGSQFNGIDELLESRLPLKDVQNIDTSLRKFENRQTKAQANLEACTVEIEKLINEEVPEGEIANKTKQDHELNEKEFESVSDDLSTNQALIDQDEEKVKLKNKYEKDLDKKQALISVWQKLRELIGSSDGKKFRIYAQKVSLDVLTRHANLHLKRLNDRYLVSRSTDSVLGLEIEDLHQAGIKRPMESLSGGESFLVSLALALGLSDLAGRNVQIGSLFIDEGFGSLDSDTLEIAIDSLEALLQQEKTVGVISHVPLLQERIATQIHVEKQSGGVSRLTVQVL